MLKVSAGLAAIALVLLVVSVIPWVPAGTEEPSEGAKATMAPDLVVAGRALFRAKGCVTCHTHAAVSMPAEGSPEQMIQGDGAAPNLTSYQVDPEFVRLWLRDPAAVRPGTRMPNLELSEDEIDALIAFLDSAAELGP